MKTDMDENRFFKFIWRFNGLILMIVGVLAIGVLGFSGYKMFRDVRHERTTRNIVNVVEDQQVDEKWQLGHLINISGSSYVVVPLYSDQKYAQSYFSKSSDSTRNLLFIDVRSNQKKWLFKTNDYLIVNQEFLSEKEINGKDEVIRAILYMVVKKDTNGDKRLTADDKMDIALSTPGGDNYKEVVTGIDGFIGHRVIDKDTVFIIYQKQGTGYSGRVDLRDFSFTNQMELPKVKNRT